MVGLKRSRMIVEGADYLVDMEESISRNKRRRDMYQFGVEFINSRKKRGRGVTRSKGVICDEEDSRLDKVYDSFLVALEEFCDAKFVEEDEADPAYMMFFDNLKENGNAYMLGVSNENGVHLPIMYEVDSVDPGEAVKRKTSKSGRGKYVKKERSLRLDNNDDLGSGLGITGSQKIKAEPVDEYNLVLDSLKATGESTFFEYGDCKRVYYELAGEQNIVEVEIRQSDIAPRASTPLSTAAVNTERPSTQPLTALVSTSKPRTPASSATLVRPTSKDHHVMLNTSGERLDNNFKESYEEHSSFWETLHEILRQPYKKKEHEDLWKQLGIPTPVLNHRDSRSGGSDRPGHMGRSLLDWYPELKCEIDKAKSDPLKVLNLLRMLSYYVQMVADGTIPKPWKDECFKMILPGSP